LKVIKAIIIIMMGMGTDLAGVPRHPFRVDTVNI